MIEIIKQDKGFLVKDSRRKELNDIKKTLSKETLDSLNRFIELEKEIKAKIPK